LRMCRNVPRIRIPLLQVRCIQHAYLHWWEREEVERVCAGQETGYREQIWQKCGHAREEREVE
jgi:hypothetical protein